MKKALVATLALGLVLGQMSVARAVTFAQFNQADAANHFTHPTATTFGVDAASIPVDFTYLNALGGFTCAGAILGDTLRANLTFSGSTAGAAIDIAHLFTGPDG